MKYLLAAVVGLAGFGSAYLSSLLVTDVVSFMTNGSILDPDPMEIVGLLVVATSCSVIIVMTAVLLGTSCYLMYDAVRKPTQTKGKSLHLVIS